jgi:hypothetical protein
VMREDGKEAFQGTIETPTIKEWFERVLRSGAAPSKGLAKKKEKNCIDIRRNSRWYPSTFGTFDTNYIIFKNLENFTLFFSSPIIISLFFTLPTMDIMFNII